MDLVALRRKENELALDVAPLVFEASDHTLRLFEARSLFGGGLLAPLKIGSSQLQCLLLTVELVFLFGKLGYPLIDPDSGLTDLRLQPIEFSGMAVLCRSALCEVGLAVVEFSSQLVEVVGPLKQLAFLCVEMDDLFVERLRSLSELFATRFKLGSERIDTRFEWCE